MQLKEEDLLHYGILRRSGRYPWGSGGPENTSTSPNKRNKQFLDYVNDLKTRGLSESEIAVGMNASISEVRAARSNARNATRQSDIAMAQRLKDKGYSNVAIGERMGKNESTVRSLLAPGAADKADILKSTADMLKSEVAEKGFIDVGTGVESFVNVAGATGVSSTRLANAVAMLREEGYAYHTVKVKQIGTGLETTVKVLAPPGTTQKDVFLNRDKIQFIGSFSEDGGRSYTKAQDPISINPKRLAIKYKEDGGAEADGVVFVRPGVKDVSLGGTPYAQVRIKIGDGHYVKGMAMYKDDLPDGVDLVFNVNKTNTGNKLDALKALKDDPELPFGTIVRQIGDNFGTPKAKITSAMNIVNEQGDWEKWSKTLSSQMLSKQSPALVRSQLDMTFEQRRAQHAAIKDLTNPVVRKRLLEDFAAGTDAASVHLKAAALPQQATHVILPISKIEPTQIFAPNYPNGTRVVLIRHPHGGPFEIPELVVNNRNAEGRKLLGNSRDAVGIHHSVAERLSGADFDGDTVLVIPNNQRRVRSDPALADLKGFDPQSSYPGYSGMRKMTNTQTEMGKISNLITDMSLRQAPPSELARAVKHSMVVIDAEKHGLNYKQSYDDNGIKQLKAKYQSGGASTLISRAKSRIDVPERKPRTVGKGGPVDPTTGELRFEPTNKVNFRSGRPVTTRSTKLAEVSDAHVLSSGTPVERIYANHSNRLKNLANQARLDAIKTPTPKQSPSARKTYAKEVGSLESKLALAIKNRPLERQAQLIANATVKAKRDYNPNMDSDTIKKIKFQALAEARNRTGAGKQKIHITSDEWQAIQANAVSASKLNEILNNADMDVVKDLAAPRTAKLMTPVKTNRAQAMLASGYTRAEVASALGVSLTTLDIATVA
jgi:DNA-binding CsgD family transcriptional regulator